MANRIHRNSPPVRKPIIRFLVSRKTRLILSKTVTGSSGGAAAALAAHMVPMADGSDLGGSLRSPASVCGVVGFRPTAGQVPKLGNTLPFDSLHVFGPMARSVEDIALFMSVFAGRDARCPLSATAGEIDFNAELKNTSLLYAHCL